MAFSESMQQMIRAQGQVPLVGASAGYWLVGTKNPSLALRARFRNLPTNLTRTSIEKNFGWSLTCDRRGVYIIPFVRGCLARR